MNSRRHRYFTRPVLVTIGLGIGFCPAYAQNVAREPTIRFLANYSLRYDFPVEVNLLDSDAIGLMGKGDWENAIQKFTASLTIMLKNPRALANRSYCYQATGQMDHAFSDYKEAISIAPEIRGVIENPFLNRGRSRIDEGDLSGAEADLEEASKDQMAQPKALSELAYLASSQQKYTKCVALATESIKLDPQFLDPVITKGACLSGSGQHEQAIKWLTKALSMDPTSATAHLNRAGAYAATHNCKAAKEDSKMAVKLDNNLAESAQQILAPCK